MPKYFHPPHIDPIAFSFLSLDIHWYGIMYMLGFIFIFWMGNKKIKSTNSHLTNDDLSNLIGYGILGVIAGGRIGYILFYNLDYYIKNPLEILNVQDGGMSFHGGMIGVGLMFALFSYKNKKEFLYVIDFIVPLIPFGLALGRFGNFINGELWGKVAVSLPWAFLFPQSRDSDISYVLTHPDLLPVLSKYNVLPRHPSQLYELILEGVVLFLILNIAARKIKYKGQITGLFLFFYGLFRVFLENFRQPDEQVGLFFNAISMGQLLSIPMVIIGATLFLMPQVRNKSLKLS